MIALLLALQTAAIPARICATLTENITRLERKMSVGEMVPSVLNETMATTAMAEIQTNVAQLAAARCPAYPYVITTKAFSGAARQCASALAAMSVEETAGNAPRACDRTAWMRDQ